jgi:hypothetical protein
VGIGRISVADLRRGDPEGRAPARASAELASKMRKNEKK